MWWIRTVSHQTPALSVLTNMYVVKDPLTSSSFLDLGPFHYAHGIPDPFLAFFLPPTCSAAPHVCKCTYYDSGRKQHCKRCRFILFLSFFGTDVAKWETRSGIGCPAREDGTDMAGDSRAGDRRAGQRSWGWEKNNISLLFSLGVHALQWRVIDASWFV